MSGEEDMNFKISNTRKCYTSKSYIQLRKTRAFQSQTRTISQQVFNPKTYKAVLQQDNNNSLDYEREYLNHQIRDDND